MVQFQKPTGNSGSSDQTPPPGGPLAYNAAGRLEFDGVPVARLAQEFGTPLFVYSARHIHERLAEFRAGVGGRKHLICYAIKANSNLALLRLMHGAGIGADIVSGGELFRSLKAGIPADRIVFAGVGKSAAEIDEALTAGIHMFSVESEAELREISRIAAANGRQARISIRVNPDVDAATHPYISTGLKENKFGVSHEDVLALYELVRELPGVVSRGIGFHIGSQLLGLDAYRDAAARVRGLLEELRRRGFSIDHLDVGGGLGIQYENEEPPGVAEYARTMFEAFPEADFPDLTLVFEPGRSLVGNAGVLLTRVLYAKGNAAKHFEIVDAAMNDLIRPALYSAFHQLWPDHQARLNATREADLVGPICESGDFLVRGRRLPVLEQGDVVALASAGAYGFVMSSNYNSRPRAAEVLVESDPAGGAPAARVIRERETYDDLIRGEG
ncbi:MAG: diaminopimelate decarboxylase [Leptospirales bacterium]|jgi:diaminopimelate decarboxylase